MIVDRIIKTTKTMILILTPKRSDVWNRKEGENYCRHHYQNDPERQAKQGSNQCNTN